MTVPLVRATSVPRAVRDERGACDVDVAESAAALLYGAHHDRREDAAVQDGEDDVAAACEEARGVPADEADLLVLALGEAGEDVFGGCGELQSVPCGGMDDSLAGAVCATVGYECENLRRCGKSLHEDFSLRPVHFGSPFIP